MKWFLILALFFSFISCKNNEKSGGLNNKMSVIELIDLLKSEGIKAKKGFFIDVKFTYDGKLRVCDVISIKNKKPNTFIIEGDSKQTKIDCFYSDKELEWQKVCSNEQKCSMYFCECLLKLNNKTNHLLYSPRSKTIYLHK